MYIDINGLCRTTVIQMPFFSGQSFHPKLPKDSGLGKSAARQMKEVMVTAALLYGRRQVPRWRWCII
jgi:hypothetical protein